MLYTKASIKTIKENPSESNLDSYSLMVRASIIKKMGSTYYSYLPTGNKVLNRVLNLINKKIGEAGILEVFNGYNNETMLYSIVKDLINKDKDFPVILSSTKEINRVDNIKSGYGLIYNYLTLIKKIESLTENLKQARKVFNKVTLLLIDLFNELNIKIQPIQVGEDKAEILSPLKEGDREYFLCDICNYASDSDYIIPYFYKSILPYTNKMEKVHTPNIKSIDDLSMFFKQPKSKFIKTLFFDADGRKILAITRGDRRISEEKLKEVLDCNKLEQEDSRYVERVLALPVGFIGPINLENIFIISDYSVKGMRDAITGANEKDFHYKNVNITRDFSVDMIANITDTMNDDSCPICKQGKLLKGNGLVLSKLAIDKNVSNIEFSSNNKVKKAIISNYELDINRTISMIVEQNNDKSGIIWPKSTSPYDVIIIVVKNNDLNMKIAVEFEISFNNKTVLIDDRNHSMGIKFKDSELLGIPFRIIVSKNSIKEDLYELFTRKDLKTRKMSFNDIIKVINDNGRKL